MGPKVATPGDGFFQTMLVYSVSTFRGLVTLGGHLVSYVKDTAPVFTPGPAMTGVSVTPGSTDLAGRITFTITGALAAGGVVGTLTFARPYLFQPFAVANESRGQGSVINAYWVGSDATKLQFVVGPGGLLAGTQYSIDYHVIGPTFGGR